MTWTESGLKSKDHKALTVKVCNHSFDQWSRGHTQVSNNNKTTKGAHKRQGQSPRSKNQTQTLRGYRLKTGCRNKRAEVEPKSIQQMSNFKIKEEVIIYNQFIYDPRESCDAVIKQPYFKRACATLFIQYGQNVTWCYKVSSRGS